MIAEKLVGGQGEIGSFHWEAMSRYYQEEPDVHHYVPYPTHAALLQALFNPENIHQAIIAVDNNTSGRVSSAIGELAKHQNLQIIGSITIPVDHHLLVPHGRNISELEAVLSQKPALDQCRTKISAHGLIPVEYHDTTAAVGLISLSGGKYMEYDHVAALGSKTAGDRHGLETGPVFSDANNATKFWIVSDGKEDNEDISSTHTAITFEVPDEAGQLLRAIGLLSVKYGLNLTDIDSHLAPSTSTSRAFFTEIEHEDIDKLASAIQDLDKLGFLPNVLGHYKPKNELIVVDGNLRVPPALRHDEWQGRTGLVYPENATTLYVETKHKTASLYRLLDCLNKCNLVDLGRPIVPKDHELNRGFYVVIDPETSKRRLDDAVKAVLDEGYKVEHVRRQDEAA